MKKKWMSILGVLLMLGAANVLADSVSPAQYSNNRAAVSYCHDTTHDHHGC